MKINMSAKSGSQPKADQPLAGAKTSGGKKTITLFVLMFLIVPWFAMAANPCGGGNATGDITALPKCINQIYIWSLGIGTLLALLMMIFGGYLYMTASGNAEQSGKGVDFIWSSVIGLALLFCAFILLSTINPELVNFNLTQGLCYNTQTKLQITATSKADCESKTGKWYSVFEKDAPASSQTSPEPQTNPNTGAVIPPGGTILPPETLPLGGKK